MDEKQIQNACDAVFNIFFEYSSDECVKALLNGDSDKLSEIRPRHAELEKAKADWLAEIRSGDERRKQAAINGLKRPSRGQA